MPADIKPITIYGNVASPCPFKVTILFRELDLPYEVVDIPYDVVKEPSYTIHNPNGRLPTIHDPNTDITLWESGAIFTYLLETYDKEHKLSFPAGSHDFHHANQWLHFQVSGQGPYYGQWYWFANHHAEKVESATVRYANEMKRVTGVIDQWLATGNGKGGREYIMGDKLSFVDLAFVPWQSPVPTALKGLGIDMKTEFPHAHAWYERLAARPHVAELLEVQSQLHAAKAAAAKAAKEEKK